MIEYTPLPGQERFLKLPHKYRAFVGGIGSGKTYIGSLLAVIKYGRGESGMVVAPTYRMLKDVTQPQILEFLDAHNIPYEYKTSEEKLINPFNSSVRILFRSGEKPDRLRGPNLTWGYLDEMALMKDEVWKVLMGRLRVGRASAWGTTTPAGYNWVYRRWVEAENPRYGMVQASSRENTFLPEEYVEDLEADYTEAFAQQEIEGKFVSFEGLVYPEFREDVHVIDDFEIPRSWPVYRAIDYGYKNPFVCLWAAVDEDGRLYFFDEHYYRKQLIGWHAKKISGRGYENQIKATVADTDAQDNAEMAAYGIPTVNAKKDVMVGIRAVKARLAVAGDGRPRLFLTRSCVNTLKEYYSYHWQEAREGRNEKEEPAKESDHAMDALRYLVAYLDQPVISVGSSRGATRRLTAGMRGREF